jgi:hypothetical protein
MFRVNTCIAATLSCLSYTLLLHHFHVWKPTPVKSYIEKYLVEAVLTRRMRVVESISAQLVRSITQHMGHLQDALLLAKGLQSRWILRNRVE